MPTPSLQIVPVLDTIRLSMGAGGIDDPMKRNGMQPTPSLAGRSREKRLLLIRSRGGAKKRHGRVWVSSGFRNFSALTSTNSYCVTTCINLLHNVLKYSCSSRVSQAAEPTLALSNLNYTLPPTSPSYVQEPRCGNTALPPISTGSLLAKP